jgi:adenine-specific DNA-methyltransferase
MSQQPEKFEATSASITDEQKAKLKSLFPEIITEGGKIDFDRLKLTLGEAVDAGKERYGMNWPGKAECFKTIQQSSMATLIPARDESVNFDTTENLIIEGDNLETLKLLQKAYLGKVKMIYIDPPYNTGNDFIYPDNFSESLETYLRYTGQTDEEGRKFSTNSETDGRFHSKWMNMMYPRLFLARNLLREDGVAFISIDDHEVNNLRKLCDEVFGEENFVATLVWEKSKKGDAKLIAVSHEYVLVVAKNKQYMIEKGIWRRKKPGAEEVLSHYQQIRQTFDDKHDAISNAMRAWYSSLPKNDPRRAHEHYRWSDKRGLYFADNFAGPDDGRESRPRYDIIHPETKKPCKKPSTGWRWDEERTKQALLADPPLIHFGPDETTIPCRKSYLADISYEPFASVFYRDGRAGTLELEKLVGKGLVEFPKDKDILADFIDLATEPDSIVLDFFAGSGTTAQAVLEKNIQDGGRRKFVLVQLPEPATHTQFPTIADITKQRVRAVLKKLHDEGVSQLPLQGQHKGDHGFKVFKLQSSNFKAWNTEQPKDEAELGKQLTLHVDHLVAGRTQDDVLYELLLKSGFPLDTKVEQIAMAGKIVFSIADGAMLICLEKELTPEVIKAMAEKKPERVVCLDAGFANNDQLKTNAVQTMKAKGVTKFQTV